MMRVDRHFAGSEMGTRTQQLEKAPGTNKRDAASLTTRLDSHTQQLLLPSYSPHGHRFKLGAEDGPLSLIIGAS